MLLARARKRRRRQAAPIVARQYGALNAERVEEIDEVATKRSLLPAAHRICGQEAGGAKAAQIERDHARPCLRQTRRNFVVGVHIVGKAMRQDDWPPLPPDPRLERHLQELWSERI